MEYLRTKSGFNVKLCEEGHKVSEVGNQKVRVFTSPLLRIVCATNNSRRASNPSRQCAAGAGRGGEGRREGEGRSAAVGDPFINQPAGAKPRLAPLNRKPPGVFNGTLCSAVFPYYLGGEERIKTESGEKSRQRKSLPSFSFLPFPVSDDSFLNSQ